MILTMTKYHENLLRDSHLSLLSVVKLFSSLETKQVLKIRNETFLRITRYHRQTMNAEVGGYEDSIEGVISLEFDVP